MPMYASRHANSVFVPRRKGTVEVFSVGSVVAPDVDIDNPKFVPVEWYIPGNGARNDCHGMICWRRIGTPGIW
eukprot:Skav226580  [mRNA]  locus=scaffold2846:85150:85681:- [translate_table: standard]